MPRSRDGARVILSIVLAHKGVWDQGVDMESRERLLLEFDEVCAMVGLDLLRARGALEAGWFPAPEAIGDGQYWDPVTVWTWCAGVFPEIAARAPLQCWQADTAELVAARDVGGAVAQDWQVAPGVLLRLVWPLTNGDLGAWARAGDLEPQVPQLVVAARGSGFNPLTGPDLRIHRCDGVGQSGPDPRPRPSWGDLAAALGGTAPWWPRTLRVSDAILAWKPGASLALVSAVTAFDVEPLLRLAGTVSPDGAVYRVLVDTASAEQTDATESAYRDIADLLEAGLGEIVEIAAEPVPVTAWEPVDDELQHRVGWWEILDSTDPLALEVARTVRARGNIGVPQYKWVQVDVCGPVSGEWVGRLEPVTRHTGAHELLVDEPERVAQHLVDPLTGVAVVRLRYGVVRTAIPDRLPACTPLAALEFEATAVWVRVADGAVYPMPGEYLSYGPHGNCGPLAVRIEELLDDITAAASGKYYGASPGIKDVAATDWVDGTIVTRSQLERARSGRQR